MKEAAQASEKLRQETFRIEIDTSGSRIQVVEGDLGETGDNDDDEADAEEHAQHNYHRHMQAGAGQQTTGAESEVRHVCGAV